MFTISVKRKNPGFFKKLVRVFRKPDPEVHIGLPKGEANQDVIERAVFNEFGTRGGASGGGWGGPIPERPFLRNAMRNNQGNYRNAMRSSAAKILKGDATPTEVLSKLGILAKTDVQTEIQTLASPPNSPTTVKLKGSSNPLIDTGEMRGAITYKVQK